MELNIENNNTENKKNDTILISGNKIRDTIRKFTKVLESSEYKKEDKIKIVKELLKIYEFTSRDLKISISKLKNIKQYLKLLDLDLPSKFLSRDKLIFKNPDMGEFIEDKKNKNYTKVSEFVCNIINTGEFKNNWKDKDNIINELTDNPEQWIEKGAVFLAYWQIYIELIKQLTNQTIDLNPLLYKSKGKLLFMKNQQQQQNKKQNRRNKGISKEEAAGIPVMFAAGKTKKEIEGGYNKKDKKGKKGKQNKKQKQNNTNKDKILILRNNPIENSDWTHFNKLFSKMLNINELDYEQINEINYIEKKDIDKNKKIFIDAMKNKKYTDISINYVKDGDKFRINRINFKYNNIPYDKLRKTFKIQNNNNPVKMFNDYNKVNKAEYIFLIDYYKNITREKSNELLKKVVDELFRWYEQSLEEINLIINKLKTNYNIQNYTNKRQNNFKLKVKNTGKNKYIEMLKISEKIIKSNPKGSTKRIKAEKAYKLIKSKLR